MSSTRLMNSGRKCCCTISITRLLHLRVIRLAGQLLDHVRAEVRGHDDHGVAEVDRAALAVGEAAVVQDLQQHVEHVRVRLLDFVEQQHRIRPAAHGLGQITAFLVANVARRRADQARDRMLLHELRHVDAHHRLFGIEQEFASALHSSVLPTPVGPRNRNEPFGRFGSDRPARERRIASETAAHGFPLADDALGQCTLPCAAAYPSRLRASSRRECRSTSRRPRRLPRRSPCCAAASLSCFSARMASASAVRARESAVRKLGHARQVLRATRGFQFELARAPAPP